MGGAGIVFAPPQIDLERLRAWKNHVVTRLTNGLALLAKQRKVDVIHGEATITGPFSLQVQMTRAALEARRFPTMHHCGRVRGHHACRGCRMTLA